MNVTFTNYSPNQRHTLKNSGLFATRTGSYPFLNDNWLFPPYNRILLPTLRVAGTYNELLSLFTTNQPLMLALNINSFQEGKDMLDDYIQHRSINKDNINVPILNRLIRASNKAFENYIQAHQVADQGRKRGTRRY